MSTTITTKDFVHKELAKTPGLWMDTRQLHRVCPAQPPYSTVARALRKLREEGKVISQPANGTAGLRQWRIKQSGSSVPASTPASTTKPGNGHALMKNTVSLQQAVDTVVADFIKTNKTFSAHDVSLEVRDRVNAQSLPLDPTDGTCHVNGTVVPRVVHAKVRDCVHTKYDQGGMDGYDRVNSGMYLEYAPSVAAGSDDSAGNDDADDATVSVVAVGGSYNGSSSL